MVHVNAILDDVRSVTAKVKEETERVEHAIHSTMDRIDDTADRLRSNVRVKTSAVVGFLRGLRVALEYMRRSQYQAHEHASQHEHIGHHEHIDEGETTWQTDPIVPATTTAAAEVS